MQPLEVILSQDHGQIVALLEYVRYDFQPKIQQFSIKIMSILRHILHPFLNCHSVACDWKIFEEFVNFLHFLIC